MFATDLPESVIKRLSIRVKERSGINLGQGIPPFPTAPHIINVAKKVLDEPNIGVYPNFLGTIELREAIVRRHNRESNIKLKAEENVLVTVGAMEATAAAILSVVATGSRVGVITPDYCNHFPQIQLARGRLVEIPMQQGNEWELDIAKIEKAARQGLELLILTNPNNPTGAVIGHTQLAELVKLSEKYGFWLLVDETYAFLDYSGKFASLLNFWNECERLLVVRSFSKEFAMTGWRVGYVLAHRKALGILAKTHDALTGCAPKISQAAALAALGGPKTTVVSYQQILTKRKELACKLLSQIGSLTFATPLGAYYIFPKYKQKIPSAKLSNEILQKVGVGVVPGSVFGKVGEGHIRISFAASEENLKEGMKRLAKYFKN